MFYIHTWQVHAMESIFDCTLFLLYFPMQMCAACVFVFVLLLFMLSPNYATIEDATKDRT